MIQTANILGSSYSKNTGAYAHNTMNSQVMSEAFSKQAGEKEARAYLGEINKKRE